MFSDPKCFANDSINFSHFRVEDPPRVVYHLDIDGHGNCVGSVDEPNVFVSSTEILVRYRNAQCLGRPIINAKRFLDL